MKSQQETDGFATARQRYIKLLILWIIVLLVSSWLAPFSLFYVFAALFIGFIDYCFTLLGWKHCTGAWSHIPDELWSGLSVGILFVSQPFIQQLCFPNISENNFVRGVLVAQFLSVVFAFSTALLLLFPSKTKQYLATENQFKHG
jgi:hypothetical protein